MAENAPQTLSIGEAAKLLNVHRNTVRNRIKAGRYKAYKVVTPQGETYAVTLESIAQDVQSTPSNPSQPPVHHNPAQGAQTSSVASADQQDAVVRLVQQMLAPFVHELGETKQELGRVTAERDELQHRAVIQEEAARLEREQIQAERDAMERRVRALEAIKRSSQDTTAHRAIERDTTPQPVTHRAWWRFWER